MSWYAELKSVFSAKPSATFATSATSEENKHVTEKSSCYKLATSCYKQDEKKPCSKFVAPCSKFVANEKTLNIEENKLVTGICSNVADVARVEKSLLPKVPPQHASTDYKTAPLMVSVTGKPLHCIHCAAWVQGQGVWWSGSCMHTGESRNNKSRCTLEVLE